MHEVQIGSDIVARLTARRGRYHLYDAIDPAQAAFVVVDMQNAFCKPGAPAEVPAARGIVANVNALAKVMRAAGGQVIWIVSAFDSKGGRSDWENFFNYIVAADVREKTMQYMAPGAEGTALWHELDLHEEDSLIEKNRYSCLAPGASQLERVLRSRGIEYLLIGGTKTNICCETTARAAFDMDFKVVLVNDCCAALSEREHLAALENVIQQFGDVMSVAEVSQRLK
jgi:ureidoacrylate peracid hydrolase